METTQQKKKKDILKFTDKQINLEKNILSEVTQIQKDKYNMFSLISGFSHKAKKHQPIVHNPREPIPQRRP